MEWGGRSCSSHSAGSLTVNRIGSSPAALADMASGEVTPQCSVTVINLDM